MVHILPSTTYDSLYASSTSHLSQCPPPCLSSQRCSSFDSGFVFSVFSKFVLSRGQMGQVLGSPLLPGFSKLIFMDFCFCIFFMFIYGIYPKVESVAIKLVKNKFH